MIGVAYRLQTQMFDIYFSLLYVFISMIFCFISSQFFCAAVSIIDIES